jgi:hypothetical protein
LGNRRYAAFLADKVSVACEEYRAFAAGRRAPGPDFLAKLDPADPRRTFALLTNSECSELIHLARLAFFRGQLLSLQEAGIDA